MLAYQIYTKLFLSLSAYCKVLYCMYVGVGKIETTFVLPAVNAPSGKIRQVCTNGQRFTNKQRLFFMFSPPFKVFGPSDAYIYFCLLC